MPKIVNKTEENSRMVTQLSGLGLPHEQICSILDISKPSLYKYYQEELAKGKATAVAKVAENLYKIATGDPKDRNTLGGAIFFLKTQAKWSEKQVLEIQDGTEEDDKFKKLISNIQRAKLAEKDSDTTLN
tara:strand:- start:455 stop:844 length:390 start_codon:yes stop_codon:yes gene_type:complete